MNTCFLLWPFCRGRKHLHKSAAFCCHWGNPSLQNRWPKVQQIPIPFWLLGPKHGQMWASRHLSRFGVNFLSTLHIGLKKENCKRGNRVNKKLKKHWWPKRIHCCEKKENTHISSLLEHCQRNPLAASFSFGWPFFELFSSICPWYSLLCIHSCNESIHYAMNQLTLELRVCR